MKSNNTQEWGKFHKTKGCRRGNKCWFQHDHDHITEKKRLKLKQNPTKKVKGESNVKMESKHEQGDNMKQIIIELLKLLLRENNSQIVLIVWVPSRDCDAPPLYKMESASMTKECGLQTEAEDM